MVTKTRLWWRDEKKEKTQFFHLKGASVVKSNNFRFQLLNVIDEEEKSYNRELLADSYQEMNAWVKAITEAIERANADDGKITGTVAK